MLPQDIAGISGIDPAAVQRLAPYIAVLDERTPLNANTASPEVIAARVPELTLAEARTLVAERERVSYFNNTGEVRTRPGNKERLSPTQRYRPRRAFSSSAAKSSGPSHHAGSAGQASHSWSGPSGRWPFFGP